MNFVGEKKIHRILFWEQWTMGDAGASESSTTGRAARAGLGDRGGDSNC